LDTWSEEEVKLRSIQELEKSEFYAVKFQGVSTYYFGEAKPAITNVWLKIPPKSLTLIVGPNGSGKTTLLETLLGLLKPKFGRVKLLGYDVPEQVSVARRMCGYSLIAFTNIPSIVILISIFSFSFFSLAIF
jgi:ABC-type multidrug transport system ATPase subunit